MSQHLREPEGETEQLLAEALRARTSGVFGRSDSLADLRRAHRAENSRQVLRRTRVRRLSPAIGVLATFAAVLLVVVGVNWIGRNYKPAAAPTRPSHSSVPLPKTGFGYSPSDYYPAVNSDGQPVIVRVSDGRQMRILPRGRVSSNRWDPISPMVLSPDGNRIYGVGREFQDDGKPYPEYFGANHVLVIDLRTNQFTSLATRAGLITGMTLSADGTTFAYSLRGGQDGRPDRDVIYIHDLVHDTDRHLLLASGQRTVILALSPDGSTLAINVNGNSPDVRVISTTTGLAQPSQQSLGAAACPNSSFGAVQWTTSGLYAVRYCSSPGTQEAQAVVRISSDPTWAATVLATVSPVLHTALLVRDTPEGLAIFTDQSHGSDALVTRLALNGHRQVTVPGIRLSGPGT